MGGEGGESKRNSIRGTGWRLPRRRKQSGGDGSSSTQGDTNLSGRVRGFATRQEDRRGFFHQGQQEQVWGFRLERYREGRRLPPIPVEMRGRSFSGSINDGDLIEFRGTWRDGQDSPLRPRRVYNRTSGMTVTVRSARLAKALLVTVVVAFVMYVVISIARGSP